MRAAITEQQRRIAAAAGRLPKRLRGVLPQAFLRAYYAGVEPDDLAERQPRELAAMALSHLAFARQRRGRALVRVFNPTVREHGYTSAHTIVEMVNDDMPFLVDSIGLALNGRSLALHFLVHPVFAVARDGAGLLQSLQPRGGGADGQRRRLESFQHFEVDRIVDPAVLRGLQTQIEHGMRDVRVATADWPKMQAAARRTADELNGVSARFDPRDVAETKALLAWMENRHFTFLGYREYRLRGNAGSESLEPVLPSGLGILRPGHKHPESTNRILARRTFSPRCTVPAISTTSASSISDRRVS